MKAILMLEDGKKFDGEAAGVTGERIGEVFFNTAVVGYQEMLTDPANAGKLLVLTYPLIGNYGCAPKFNESKEVWAAGLVMKENSRMYSSWQAKQSLDDFAKGHNLFMLKGVDTRSLAAHLRNKGEMLGIVSSKDFQAQSLQAKIKASRQNKNHSYLDCISVKKPTLLSKAKGKRIAVLDLGVTRSLLRQLEALGVALTLFPFNSTAKEILSIRPHGLVISGGPEEDSSLGQVAQNVANLLGRVPLLGISTGHQIIAVALGAKMIKMKLGHHGVNYPIYNQGSFKGEVTVQNHSWVVDTDSLSRIKQIKITGYNLNDRSVEEMESRKLKVLGAQYVAACPGFEEVSPVLTRFYKMLRK